MKIQYNLYPIKKYNEHFGKPLYVFGRKKLKLGELGSLYIAKFPGTCVVFGLACALTSNLWAALACTALNYMMTPQAIHSIHQNNRDMRADCLESLAQDRQRALNWS